MALGEPIRKMKAVELRKLSKDFNIKSKGKKKDDHLEAIENAILARLKTYQLTDFLSLAENYSIDLGGKEDEEEIIDVITLALTPDTLRSLMEETLEEIGEELVEIEKDVEEVVEKVKKMPASDMADIEEIDLKLEELAHVNVDYANLGSLLDVGRVKYLDGRYIESMGMLFEATKASKEFYDEFQDLTYAFIILAAEKILEECREAKSNNEKAADALLDAKRAFSERGPRRAETTERLHKIASKVYKEELEALDKLMKKREDLIVAMKVQGVDVFHAERYLHRAKEVFLVGELAECMSYLEKSHKIASEAKDSWIKEIEDDVPRVEGIISQASEFGVDISEIANLIEKAKIALDNKDYSLCSELTKLAERKAMESQQSQIQKATQFEKEKLDDAKMILATIQPLIQEAQLYKFDTSDINKAINVAMTSIQINDYVNALTHARKAEALAKYLRTKIEAERERILASDDEFKECNICLAESVKLFDNNWARCMSCGQTFHIVTDDGKKKKWGLFGK